MPNDQEDDSQQRFALEYNLRNTLARLPNVFILAVLDCCRSKNPARGEIPDDSGIKPKNLIIIYSCPPGQVTRADSQMTEALLIKLRKIINKADNSLVLTDILAG